MPPTTLRNTGIKLPIPILALSTGICFIFVKQNSYLNGAEEVLHQLQSKGRLEKYEKNLDVFADLLPHQSEAMQRARERLDSLYKDNVVILSRDSNPVTTVCELVEYLNSQQS